MLRWLVSNQGLDYFKNRELKFTPVNPNRITADDRAAYITGLEDLIDLDAVPVVASYVSPCFLSPAEVHTIETIRRIHLVMAL